MEEIKIREAHNQCIDVLNNMDLAETELVAVLAQLLIYSGKAITKKEIDLHSMNLEELQKQYYADNADNDLGLGLILNGASIMGAIPDNIKGDVTANRGDSHDNSLPTTT